MSARLSDLWKSFKAMLSEFVDGDIYRWGALMAGALLGSLLVAVIYMLFVNHYVSAMTGAVKE